MVRTPDLGIDLEWSADEGAGWYVALLNDVSSSVYSINNFHQSSGGEKQRTLIFDVFYAESVLEAMTYWDRVDPPSWVDRLFESESVRAAGWPTWTAPALVDTTRWILDEDSGKIEKTHQLLAQFVLEHHFDVKAAAHELELSAEDIGRLDLLEIVRECVSIVLDLTDDDWEEICCPAKYEFRWESSWQDYAKVMSALGEYSLAVKTSIETAIADLRAEELDDEQQ